MDGYAESTYGDRFAAVYDDWYPPDDEADATVETVAALAGDGPVLELGVGTGRLAVPLAARDVEVHGVDASAAMLERLRSKPGGQRVRAHLADMAAVDVAELGDAGPFSVVLLSYNTFFNLDSDAAQRRCLRGAAQRLAPDGALVVDAFVPADEAPERAVELRSLRADEVVLSVSRRHGPTQTAEGAYVLLADGAPARVLPWRIRYLTPGQLDALASDAGLALRERWGGWRGEAYLPSGDRHVSVYGRAPEGPDRR